MNVRKIRNNDGFTLVELAIVITIIGILIGGVLKGQQLIDQARLAGTIAQVRDYKSAVMIFQTKYGALPGDMPNPDQRIIGCTNCAAQDDTLGDDLIGGVGVTVSDWNVTHEPIRFWLQLYKANMIAGVTDAALTQSANSIGQTIPAAKISDGFYAESATYECNEGARNTMVWGGCRPVGLLLVITPADLSYLPDSHFILQAAEVAQLDRKMDDGNPLSGDVRGASRVGAANPGCTGADRQTYPEVLSGDICSVGFIIATP